MQMMPSPDLRGLSPDVRSQRPALYGGGQRPQLPPSSPSSSCCSVNARPASQDQSAGALQPGQRSAGVPVVRTDEDLWCHLRTMSHRGGGSSSDSNTSSSSDDPFGALDSESATPKVDLHTESVMMWPIKVPAPARWPVQQVVCGLNHTMCLVGGTMQVSEQPAFINSPQKF